MLHGNRLTARDSFRMSFEQLEDRLTPSWAGVPPAVITPPTAFTTVVLNSNGDTSGMASITADEVDWYRVTIPAGSITFSAGNGIGTLDTVIGIYNTAGQRVAYNDDFNYPTDLGSQTTVNLPAGTYFFGITNYSGAAGGNYGWWIDAPSTPVGSADDNYENNDTRATAANLGTLNASRTLNRLVMRDAGDWFRFTTTGTGTSNSGVTINFSHAQGDLDMRLFNSSGTLLRRSEGTGNSETVSLNGLPAGTYFVRVYGYQGAFNPDYSMTLTPPSGGGGGGGGGSTSGFQITLRVTGMTASQQAIFQQAANRWSQVITGDLPDATYNGIAVDDVLIDASAQSIDGSGGILGQAGPDRFRSGSGLPIHGIMEFDTADLAQLEASGGLYSVILHEMGHVLGIGTIWQQLGLVTGVGTNNPRFLGPQATAAYNQIFGTNATGVPVENTGGAGTRDSHWRESVFNNELMTGFLNAGTNPLSRITVGSLADMGYQVNMNAADNYFP